MIVPLSSDRRPSSLIGSKGVRIVFMLGGTDAPTRREQVCNIPARNSGISSFFPDESVRIGEYGVCDSIEI